jgi:hypothetical protein
LKVRYLDNSIVIDVDERRPEQLTQDNERDVIRSWLYAMQDPLRSLYEQNTYLIRKLRDLEQAESEEEEASPPERKEGVEVTPGDSAVRSSPLPGPVRASTPDSPTSPSFETKQGSPMVSGTEALSDQAVEPAFDSSGSLLDPTIEEVERLFAEKAIEAVEIESALNVWDRLRQVERDDGEPTEIDQFVERTRKTIEARLEDFAGSTDSAPEALERLRSDLKRLMDLHVALVGPEGRSAEVLGTRSVRQFASSLPIESAAERGMLVQKPNDHRVWFFAQRIQSLFSGFDIELGTPVNFGNSNYGFGMMGMGGGMGGGFQ